MSRRDFSKWLSGKILWSEICWEYNTGRGYQNKQDLIAVFYNSYTYYEEKVTKYYEEFQVLPIEILEELIFDFQKYFPLRQRVSGVNYFDDLIKLLIDRYTKKVNNISLKKNTMYTFKLDPRLIIEQCYTNKSSWNNLEAYFEREAKKAERDEFYKIDDFVNEIIECLNKWETANIEAFEEHQNTIVKNIENAKAGKLLFLDYYGKCLDKEGISFEEYNEQQVQVLLNELNDKLKNLSIFDFKARTVSLSNNEITKVITALNTLKKPKDKKEVSKPTLNINKVALIHVYNGTQITRENGNDIAKEYGHNSGEKLFQRFTFYSSAANRKGRPTPCTQKKLDNKIKLLESIIELVSKDKQGRIVDEVQILRSIYDSEYL